MDEYTRLASLNRIVAGWCTYYRYTSLLLDLEEMTRYTWFRYLQWLRAKYKGSRKHQLIQAKTTILHNRTRWTAQLAPTAARAHPSASQNSNSDVNSATAFAANTAVPANTSRCTTLAP